jgi:hypothetical protein
VTVNKIMLRFQIFGVGSMILFILALRAAFALF